jgi:hypothetical protein
VPTKEGLEQWLQLLENQKADPAKREKIRSHAVELLILICEYMPPDDPYRVRCVSQIGEVVIASSHAIAGWQQ